MRNHLRGLVRDAGRSEERIDVTAERPTTRTITPTERLAAEAIRRARVAAALHVVTAAETRR